MSSEAESRRELHAVAGQLAAARTRAAAGAALDLGPLEGRVERLCAALGTLPRGVAPGFKASLLALIDELDALAAELKARHARLRHQLAGHDDHARAAAAYGRNDRSRP